MNLNPFKQATGSSPAGAAPLLEDQLAEAEAMYQRIGGIANATRYDFSPRKKLAMGQLEAASRRVQRLKFRIALSRCSSLVQAAEDSMPKAVASCKSRHGQARKAAEEAQRQIDVQSGRLARVAERLGKVTSARSERDSVSGALLEKATVAGDEAAIVRAEAGINAFLAEAASHDAEVRSLQVQHRALSAAMAEQEISLKSALDVCDRAEGERRDLEIEATALRVDAAMLETCETLFDFLMAGGRLGLAHRGLHIKPGVSKTLRAAGDLTEVVSTHFDKVTSPHYFGATHPFESRLDEDLMSLSDGSPVQDDMGTGSDRAAA